MERKLDFSWLKKNWPSILLGGLCLLAGFLVGMLIFGSPWHLPPAWGDIPGWITAIATVGLLLGAITTARYAAKAFRTQSEQLKDQTRINNEQSEVLRLQAAELRESRGERAREAEARRRSQVSFVFIWQEYREGNPALYADPPDYIAHLEHLPRGESRPVMVAHVNNSSKQPIYDLIVTWTYGGNFREETERRKPLMPDNENIDLLLMQPGDDSALFSATAVFRDAAQLRWRSRPDGQFDEIATQSAKS